VLSLHYYTDYIIVIIAKMLKRNRHYC